MAGSGLQQQPSVLHNAKVREHLEAKSGGLGIVLQLQESSLGGGPSVSDKNVQSAPFPSDFFD